MHEALSLTVWDALTDDQRERESRNVVRHLPRGFEFRELETFIYGAQRHTIARFTFDGAELSLVPGTDTAVLGYDPDRVVLSKADLELLVSFGEHETVDEAATAFAALKRDLVDQTSPRRTARIRPMLFECNARWQSFDEVSFDAPLRVPTEDEWEWAASGGSDAFFRWGDLFPLRFAPPGPEENRLGDTTPYFDAVVQPNAFGLTIARDPYDYEWCATRGIFKGGDGGVSWHGGARRVFVLEG